MVEVEPLVASEIAGAEAPNLRAFTNDLIEQGETLGLIGPREYERVWTRHILNSAVLESLINPGATVADVGTGGGFPGLVLAIIRPDVNFILIEPMERRVAWLNNQVEKLGLKNVTVKRNRAEELHGKTQVDYVSARAVSSLKKLIPACVPLLKDGGELILLKGAQVDAEIANAQKEIKRFKLKSARVEILGTGQLEETTRVFRATVDRA